jgi:hypothetical protein
MRSKLCLFAAVLTFCFSFSQRAPNDTLECSGRLNDIVMSKLENAYEDRNMDLYKKKFIKTGRILGCAYDELRDAREISCQNAKLIEKKYPFILDEIKRLAKNHPNYLDLNMFWISKEREDENDLDFKFNEADETEFEKWKSQKNHSYFSAVIISNEIDDKNEYVQLIITFPKEIIRKKYKLSYYNRQWDFKQF